MQHVAAYNRLASGADDRSRPWYRPGRDRPAALAVERLVTSSSCPIQVQPAVVGRLASQCVPACVRHRKVRRSRRPNRLPVAGDLQRPRLGQISRPSPRLTLPALDFVLNRCYQVPDERSMGSKAEHLLAKDSLQEADRSI